MRKIREILRLKWEVGLSARQIARSLSISHSTVLDMLRRFNAPVFPGRCRTSTTQNLRPSFTQETPKG